MDASGLYDTLYNLSHYAQLVIAIAAFLDIFFATGLILYGFAMLSTVGMLHMTGMITTTELVISATIGTVTGNVCNYWIGRLFGTSSFIKKRLQSPTMQKLQISLRSRGLLPFMIISRSITFTRPLYALFLGSLNISFRRFIVREIPLAFLWVSFWIVIILQGEELYSRLIL